MSAVSSIIHVTSARKGSLGMEWTVLVSAHAWHRLLTAMRSHFFLDDSSEKYLRMRQKMSILALGLKNFNQQHGALPATLIFCKSKSAFGRRSFSVRLSFLFMDGPQFYSDEELASETSVSDTPDLHGV